MAVKLFQADTYGEMEPNPRLRCWCQSMARKVTGRSDLLREADRLGIEVEYTDAKGRPRRVPRDSIEKIAAALRGTVDIAPAPPQAPTPAQLPQAYQGPGRCWLLAAQLYGVRSRRNWGHGDFTDLLDLIDLAAQVGAAGIGVNPLHALFDDAPRQPSPYSPNTRLFLNPHYIDLEAVPEFAHAGTADMAAEAERLRRTELVDHAGVATLKQQALRAAYGAFRRGAPPDRRANLEELRRARPALAAFAAFEVLRRRFPQPWWQWPAEWRDPTDETLDRLRAEAGDEIGFYEYVQWLADAQLMRCRDRARALGLSIGLYLDVAVGVQPTGFDAWHAREAVTRTLSVGAPPDALNTLGQNWRLAGFSGVGLQASDYHAFRETLRAAMRYAGAIRIDHVLGLKRLYVIPEGLSPDQGAYLRMPFETLLHVTAEESDAHRCIVIGEDLGTVPKGFREDIARYGIWSYQVMMFERDKRGAFLPPEHYAARALVTFSTHDLPTFAGWIAQHDLAVRAAIGIPAGESGKERSSAVAALRDALRIPEMDALDFPSVVRFLAASPAKLLAIALEDVMDEREQVNIPGTVDTHPNWRRKLPLDLEDVREDGVLREIARIADESGRGAPSSARRRHA
jgi:4-alpha-glucanotransferase